MPVRTRSYTIFTPGVGFTIGMSSSTDPAWYEEEEFEATLLSIRIGSRLSP